MTPESKITVASSEAQQSEITDKAGFAARWGFSRRMVDHFIAEGLPHLKIGERRIRIVIAEADQWMRDKYHTRRLGNS